MLTVGHGQPPGLPTVRGLAHAAVVNARQRVRRVPFGSSALAGACGIAIGLASSRGPKGGLALTAAIASSVLILFVPLSTLAVMLVAASQLTRGRVGLVGYNFFPEHMLVLVFLAALVVRRATWLLRRPTAFEVLLLGWIGWNGVTSIFSSPDPGKSLAIVVWMALAWMILWCVRGYFLADPSARERVLRRGAQVAAALGILAFVLWLVALLGGTRFGTQDEFVTGSLAAKGFALEANFLGSQELVWLLVVLRSRVVRGHTAPAWVVSGMLLGIAASMTRAVWLATVLVIAGCLMVSRTTEPQGAANRNSQTRLPLTRLLVAAVGIIATFSLLGSPLAKLRASLDFGTTTGQVRVRSWNTAWDDLAQSGSYLTGLGTNSFGQRHLSEANPGEPDYLGSLPLAVLHDSGVVGVMLFGGAIVAFVRRASERRARLMNALFVTALFVVGSATSPLWFGFVWIAVAAFDTDPRAGPSPARASNAPLVEVNG